MKSLPFLRECTCMYYDKNKIILVIIIQYNNNDNKKNSIKL